MLLENLEGLPLERAWSLGVAESYLEDGPLLRISGQLRGLQPIYN